MSKNFIPLFFSFILILTHTANLKAQCKGEDTLIYNFNDPSGNGDFTSYLCADVDSVGTLGANGYYNGDGFRIKLLAGTQVTFSVDSCNGAGVSLTIADSLKNIINGAYAGAACPNSLNFTAPYTGSFFIFINLNGTCNVFGNLLLGQVYVKIQTGTIIPDCPVANLINDTICGAIPLTIDSSFEQGNTSLAFPTDPLDASISSLFICSPPNNTLWYSFTAPSTIDTVNICLTSKQGGGFHSWLGIFTANDKSNACTAGITYSKCVEGPDDGAGIDTINIPLTGLLTGQVYFFMIDGYDGDTGEFSIAVKSQPDLNFIDELNDLPAYSVFPNPAKNNLYIKSLIAKDASLSLYNSIGETVFGNVYKNFLSSEIDISNLIPGFYTVTIISDKETFRTKIFVIR